MISAKKIITDFSPMFCNVREWAGLDNLTGFMISINDILKQLDRAFTVQTLFGPSVVGFFEHELESGDFVSRDQILRTNVNFMRVSVPTLVYGCYFFRLKYSDRIKQEFTFEFTFQIDF